MRGAYVVGAVLGIAAIRHVRRNVFCALTQLHMIRKAISDCCVGARSVRNLFGLSDRMVRAIGGPDIQPCSDMSTSDGLYSIERIETWLDAHGGVNVPPAAMPAHTPEWSATLEWARTVSIESIPVTWDVWWKAQQSAWDQLTEQGKTTFIRHHMTNYPALVKQLADQPAPHEAYRVLRTRADALISGWLKECQI